MAHDEGSGPDVVVRAEGAYVVWTMTPQEAQGVAQLIARTEAHHEPWLNEVANMLVITATQLDVAPQPRRNITGDRRGPSGYRPADERSSGFRAPDEKPVSGLAAALAVFTEAIGGGAEAHDAPISTRTETSAAARTRALQEILGAAEARATTTEAAPES